jgi:hypothetical protein
MQKTMTVAEKRRAKSIAAAFSFRRDQSRAYAAMANRALMLKALKKFVGTKALIEWARCELPISHGINDFKIDNSLSPALARLMIRDYPELASALRTKQAACDQDQIDFGDVDAWADAT